MAINNQHVSMSDYWVHAAKYIYIYIYIYCLAVLSFHDPWTHVSGNIFLPPSLRFGKIRQDPKDNACENQEALQQIQERGMEVFNQQARGMIGIRKRSFRLDQ